MGLTTGARIARLEIPSPKRNARRLSGWEGFFPYYAGFPESFADAVLSSAELSKEAIVLDPWNGSGTTTYAASRLGLQSVGLDINPVMAIVARARTLAVSEADTIEPLGEEILRRASRDRTVCNPDDALLGWLGPLTASWVRSVERASRELLLGKRSIEDNGTNFDNISAIASAYYITIFEICRELVNPYRSSNPTWLRELRDGERRAARPSQLLNDRFMNMLSEMTTSLLLQTNCNYERGNASIVVADTADNNISIPNYDICLTSPPYCTRIDYTAATRIQLSVLWPLLSTSISELSRSMIGSVRTPLVKPVPCESWGPTCHTFLKQVFAHKSKASTGYYYNTHLDYFYKIRQSISSLSAAMKNDGIAILVVQDSHYKEIHNDLPTIITEMATNHSLNLKRRDDFGLNNPLAGSHPYSRNYRSKITATESVLCFSKN